MLQRSRKLQPAAAYIGNVFAKDANLSSRENGRSGLVYLLLLDKDSTRQNKSAGSLPAWHDAELNEQEIEPDLQMEKSLPKRCRLKSLQPQPESGMERKPKQIAPRHLLADALGAIG